MHLSYLANYAWQIAFNRFFKTEKNKQGCIKSLWSLSSSGWYSDWQKYEDETRIIIPLSKLPHPSHALWISSHLTFWRSLMLPEVAHLIFEHICGCGVTCTCSLIVFVDSSVRRGCSDLDWHPCKLATTLADISMRFQGSWATEGGLRVFDYDSHKQQVLGSSNAYRGRFLCSSANKGKKVDVCPATK